MAPMKAFLPTPHRPQLRPFPLRSASIAAAFAGEARRKSTSPRQNRSFLYPSPSPLRCCEAVESVAGNRSRLDGGKIPPDLQLRPSSAHPHSNQSVSDQTLKISRSYSCNHSCNAVTEPCAGMYLPCQALLSALQLQSFPSLVGTTILAAGDTTSPGVVVYATASLVDMIRSYVRVVLLLQQRLTIVFMPLWPAPKQNQATYTLVGDSNSKYES